jgi:hypothetical protein
MGRLMDRIMASVELKDKNATQRIHSDLQLIAEHCRWTSGRWDGIGLRWDEVQNVPRHLNELSSFLIRLYVQAKAGR